MKRTLVILTAIALAFSTTLSAKNPPSVAAKLPADFKTEVSKNIDYPDFARQNLVEGEVMMKVTLDENSKVRIVDLSATNQELGDHVKKELDNLTIKNTSFQQGEVYYMKVKFDLLKK